MVNQQTTTKKEPPQTTFYKTVLVEVSGQKAAAVDHDSERRVTVAMKSTTSDFGVAVQCSVVAQLNPLTLEAVSPSDGLYLIETGFGWTVSGLSGLVESLRRKFKPTDQGLDSTMTTTNDQLQQQQSLTSPATLDRLRKEGRVAKNQQKKLQCDDSHAAELSLTSSLDFADQSRGEPSAAA
ncbi:hypothetical protein TYRP_019391 [Tyrophagus putrescentiae]|nr:hypothetical protein TYRP_019391 [Tyrophagus putrescentiae]